MTREGERVAELLASLEQMAGGDLEHRAAISDAHDEMDAIAYGINVIVGELAYSTRKLARAKAEAEAANEAKTDFLRNVSHEIRSPLSVILGASELLLSPKLDDARRADLSRRIVKQGRALAILLDDLLDLAKVEAQRLLFDLRPMHPHAVVAEVMESLADEARHAGVTLFFDAESADKSAVADADEQRVRQILMNVIGNAIKFANGGAVRVEQKRADGDPASIFVDVTDDGVGMSEAHAAQLFAPFQQADASVARRFGGTGLGLAISRRLARAMGGDLVLVASTLGKGSTFRVILRAALTRREEPTRRAPVTTTLQGFRILLVDDDEDVRGIMVELLTSRGASVVHVDSGEAALARARGEAFDVILMDLYMAGLTGLDATRLLRARGVRTPVIALTAAALAVREDEWREAGCEALVPKPIEIERLLAAILALRRV